MRGERSDECGLASLAAYRKTVHPAQHREEPAMTSDLPELLERHPFVAQRLADRIGEFVRGHAPAEAVRLETSEMPMTVSIEDSGVVVSVLFREAGATLAELRLDGATVGLHCPGGDEIVVSG